MKRSLIRLVCAAIIVILALSTVVTKTTAVFQVFSCDSVTEIPIGECEALVALYNSTDGDNWTDHTSWLVSNPAGSWFGVTVSGGHVTRLELYFNHLTGTIPSQLGSLPNLTYLDLHQNKLSGSIPPQLGSLANLTALFLDSNQLAGSIPVQLGSLSNLSNLNLKDNYLSGSIPPELGGLGNLTYLNLADNNMSGSIPFQLGSLANLTWLALYSNQLTGSIPPQLGSLANLDGLALNINQLSGAIPPQLGNLAMLTYLNLAHNQLSGSIPSQLGNLASLTELWLSSNQLTGSIPPELGSLTSLKYLYLQSNQLTGSIPPQLGSLPMVITLNLSHNLLSGSIPPELGNFPDLFELYLSHNHLSGSIPPELAQLGSLEYFTYLTLGNNWLVVPNPYPSAPPTSLETFLMTYAPGWEQTQALVKEIPVIGGQVQSTDGRVWVNVPSGGVSQPINLVLTPLITPDQPTGKLIFIKTSFKLEVYDSDAKLIAPYHFALPVLVTLSYQDSDAVGQDESQFILYYWDVTSSSWKDAATTCATPSIYQRNPANNTLSVQICHLTEFALLGPSAEHNVYLPGIMK